MQEYKSFNFVKHWPIQSLSNNESLENASFVHVFGCMCMIELTVIGW